ncbi:MULTISPECIES: 4-oxalocrotonate tautomerase [Pseudomonas]|uniref:4-oxalocrotonate tautomerase n=1 Tax=Pseudomonas TaxID=286 RepID=UPI00224B3D0A|nr:MULTISPECIES: 4-oxalocrotonate tautomerase [unclassified Pseudomonas]MCX2891178.1 4-oxalocrotonate tautomerase [Pseudomonas sp. DCB_BI]MDH0704937.1 4-oxalocrotonate tautomerase [Pseudomonas sp. GD03862]
MPTVRIELSPGRSREQKIRYVEEVTRVTAEILGCKPESVDILFLEIPPHEWARGGTFLAQAPE